MDTDDLTPMAYDCILFADEASDLLMTELGAAASKFKNEGEYLNGIQEYVKEIEEDPEDYLDAWNLLDSFAQSSISSLRMRLNSFTLWVTRISLFAIAIEAI